MKRKYLISGATGLLGASILNEIKKNNGHVEVIEKKIITIPLNLDCLIKSIRDSKCDVFIHCAANTNVDYCEINLDECYKVNYLLPEILSGICFSLGIKFVFISSTGIYGETKKTPYTELDEPNPTTVHHNSKYQAEKTCRITCPNSLIIRTGWLFGGDFSSKKNFVVNRIKEAKQTEGIIYSDPYQIGNPTSVYDVSERILLLIEKDISGIYNCVNTGVASRYEYVKEIISLSNLPVKVEQLSSKFDRIAKVSNNESAENYKMDLLGLPKMRGWKESLKYYINENCV
ncbi:TPA: NAD(P)-dependent oxidoreductase [Vibrio parahaemolyticus]